MNHGEIFWVELPDRGGREQRGRRPAIIWQDTAAIGGLPTVLVIPLTSRLDALRFPATLKIDPSQTNGLATTSVALAFQLGACDVRRVADQMGILSDADLQSLKKIAMRLQRLS